MSGTKLTHFIFIVLSVVFLSGCEKKASDEIDFGTVEGSVYRNEYFGLSISFPSGWSIQDQETQKELMDIGTKLAAGDDENLEAVIKASELQSVNLVAAFEHPLGAPVASNPSLMCIAEKVRHVPGIKRGSDYHFHFRKLLESSAIDVSFPRETSTEKIGGVDFDVMYIEALTAGVIIQQKQYAAISKGYALLLTITYTTDEEKASLQKLLESVTFK
ncbi:MAG: hypothetical protein FVQ79_00865 [Planctomycetes bacterium]|nr:hypothetical protein [Planctomycetota bacterium]